MAELKPCPFCGGEAAFLIWKDDHLVWMAADKCKPYVQPWAGTTVDNFQSIDAVPVVRCKGCYQSVVIGDVLHCTYWGKDTDENGYCHEGG